MPTNPPNTFFETYTRGLTADEFQLLFTRDAREAYRVLSRGLDAAVVDDLPWHRRWIFRLRLFFFAFTLKLSPARRALFGIALVSAAIGGLLLFRGIALTPTRTPLMRLPLPLPAWEDGTLWLLTGFVLVNLLFVLEVLDRFTLKNDLEIAREIQTAMLPPGSLATGPLDIDGRTRPANTVGGDFYDVLSLPDGRVVIALGDVAGKGSPASLLMALLLAMLRTIVDEDTEPAALTSRLNTQIVRHALGSRFITLFVGLYDPATDVLRYVNAGQMPPLLRRRDGRVERLETGGIALGMFEGSTYAAAETGLTAGDVLTLYSDGVTEAEDREGTPFDEAGLERALEMRAGQRAADIGAGIVSAVEAHARATKLADDLTVLVVRHAGG
jgi:serine phosphatase RsbU (regulator of sigma subunit)